MRELQEAGDAGKGSQVTTENSVEVNSERRRTGTQVSVEEWVTPGGNRFWELRMRVAVAQPKVHADSELGTEGIPSSHTLENDRKPARAPRPDTPSAEQDSEQIAGMMTENRNIITVSLGSRLYRALIDSGAMVSLIGTKIARHFRDKLRPSATAVRGVSGNALRVLGALRVRISIDNGSKELEVRVTEGIDHEIILEIQFANNLWRVLRGEFREFSDCSADDAPVMMECASIAKIAEVERESVMRLVASIVPPPAPILGHINLITHRIEVTCSRSVKCAPRRMSPKMLEVAQEEVRKMLREGVIERSDSEWCSALVIVAKSNIGSASTLES